jgi:uncharacterized membrane protein
MHMLAVRGVGIAIPILVPPVATAIVAVLMAPQNAAALAYVRGSLGILIGADLLCLSVVRQLGAPVRLAVRVHSTAYFNCHYGGIAG